MTTGAMVGGDLRRDEIPETTGVPLLAAVVGGTVVSILLAVLLSPLTAIQRSIAGSVARLVENPAVAGIEPPVMLVTPAAAAVSFRSIRRRTQASSDAGIRTVPILRGSVVAFSSGGSQVGLATGPLENLSVAGLGLSGIRLLSFVAVGVPGGAWMGSPNIFQATSREYAQRGVSRSIAALVPGVIIAQLALAPAILVSFDDIIVSGLLGGGFDGDRRCLEPEDRHQARDLAHHQGNRDRARP